jgi:dihydrofolate reductase
MPEVVIIAAVAKNGVIGRNNELIWNIPADMAHFKALTAGHTVIMGRKTWESLPPRFRPLPGRRNIVISRQVDYPAPGAEVADSLESALDLASTAATVFIIGGEQIYTQAMALADRLEITEVISNPRAMRISNSRSTGKSHKHPLSTRSNSRRRMPARWSRQHL